MNASPSCVWLVDDDEDDLMLMQAAFQTVAPEVEVKMLLNGDELLPQLQSVVASPNLVLLDLNMAHSNGFETLMRLRTIGDYGQLPIVMLTTSTNPIDRHRSEVLGANDYYTKPTNFQDLAELARRLIRQWMQ